jgi:hypothetical protein
MIPFVKEFTFVDALTSLRPGSEWYCQSPLTLENVVWQDTVNVIPSQQECDAEILRLQAEYDAKEYQRQREPNYPPIADQLDMLWHAIDNGTLNKSSDFYTSLKSIKEQYPKP